MCVNTACVNKVVLLGATGIHRRRECLQTMLLKKKAA